MNDVRRRRIRGRVLCGRRWLATVIGERRGLVLRWSSAIFRDLIGQYPILANRVDAVHYEQFRRLLEAEQPNVLFTHWPIDNHADHRAISLLAYEAWLRMGKKFALFYYEVSNGEDTVQFNPTHYVDIAGSESRKRAACYAHASQAPEKFYALQELVTRMRGIESGHKQAEGYIRHVQSPDFSLPL